MTGIETIEKFFVPVAKKFQIVVDMLIKNNALLRALSDTVHTSHQKNVTIKCDENTKFLWQQLYENYGDLGFLDQKTK